MKKIFIHLLLLSNLLHADYLLQTLNVCIKDYWYSGAKLYYIGSQTNQTYNTTNTFNYGDDIFDGYEYNATTNICKKIPTNNTLGMKSEDFNYLNALVAILISVLMLWSLVW